MSTPDLNLTSPEKCESLTEIRTQMDLIDQEIIRLIAQRVFYVKSAARFKTSATDVAAPDRVQAVLHTRREWAEQAGLDGSVIEELYRNLVTYSIREEKKHWESLQSKA